MLTTTGTPSRRSYNPTSAKLTTITKTGKNKKGKQTLGTVNSLAQCTAPTMRCVGPYAASWLYTRGLVLKLGSEPLPESPVFEDAVSSGTGASMGIVVWILNAFVRAMDVGVGAVRVTADRGGKNGGLAREIASVLVYGVLLVLVAFTFVVGLHLPVVPWKDEEEEEEAEAESVEDGEDTKIHKR